MADISAELAGLIASREYQVAIEALSRFEIPDLTKLEAEVPFAGWFAAAFRGPTVHLNFFAQMRADVLGASSGKVTMTQVHNPYDDFWVKPCMIACYFYLDYVSGRRKKVSFHPAIQPFLLDNTQDKPA